MIEETVTWAPLFEVILPRDCQFEDFCAVYRTNSGPSLLRFLTPDMWAVGKKCLLVCVALLVCGLSFSCSVFKAVAYKIAQNVFSCDLFYTRYKLFYDCLQWTIVLFGWST